MGFCWLAFGLLLALALAFCWLGFSFAFGFVPPHAERNFTLYLIINLKTFV
jgi:hypothetical protein